MHYNSIFLWEKSSDQKDNPVSLVLQQVTVRRQEVLFACVCESDMEGEKGVRESGYFTESLVEWFHREFLKCLEKKPDVQEVERQLQKEAERVLREVEQYASKKGFIGELHFCSLLLVQNRFWICERGRKMLYLLNRRFNRKNMQPIGDGSGELQIRAGSLQKKLGLLLCTPSMLSHLTGEEVAQVLLTEGEVKEARLEKGLKELWQVNAKRGEERPVGAVYIRT